MTADEWEQIKTAFEGALNVPEPERIAYLQACGYPCLIRDTVLELLENHDQAPAVSSLPNPLQQPSLREGELIGGRFRIVRFIAAGGMGEVYEVYDEQLRHRIALKTLRIELTEQAEAVERFRREILIARDASHENICRVFDFIAHRSANGVVTPCFTMELIQGESLAQMLAKRRPLKPGEALPLIRQIASGLQALHSCGIIHRDLKPSNIMLAAKKSGQIRAVVMDFGVAKAEDRSGDLFESQADFRAGAPYFMAPEVLRKERPGIASDIYSLGLVIDEMVTRSPAFTSKSLQGLYFSKLWEKPIPPGERSDSLPPRWESVILCCLSDQIATRFRSAQQVVEALEDSAQPLPLVPPLATERNPRRMTRRAIFTAVGVAGTAVAATALGVALKPGDSSIDVFDIENQTGDESMDYLCRGTTREVMRRLAQVDGVHVIPMHATRANPPNHKPATFSLDGLLQAQRRQIRLSVMMTDNRTGALVWSQQFDSNQVENSLDLQTDISLGTVAGLKQQMAFGEPGGLGRLPLLGKIRNLLSFQIDQNALATTPTKHRDAWDLYMRGRQLLEEVSPDSIAPAAQLFRNALAIDPKFALASAALSEAYLTLSDYRNLTDADMFRLARTSAETAAREDPGLSEAHLALAAVHQAEWDWDNAALSFRDALRIKPKFAKALRWYAGFLLQFGRFDETIDYAKKSIELDPFDRAAPTSYGLYLLFAGRCQQAISVMTAAVEGKDMPGTRHNLGQAYLRLATLSSGPEATRYQQLALSQAQRVSEIERRTHAGSQDDGRPLLSDRMFAIFHSTAGDLRSAEPYTARVIEDVRNQKTSPICLSWIYAAQGRNAEALNLIEEGVDRKDRRLMYLKVNTFYDPLQKEPRYRECVNRMRL